MNNTSPYGITAENIGAVIGIVARYGLKITIGYTNNGHAAEYAVLIEDEAWPKNYRRKDSGRYGDGEASELHEAFEYAFAIFCNDFDGAMYREIANLP